MVLLSEISIKFYNKFRQLDIFPKLPEQEIVVTKFVRRFDKVKKINDLIIDEELNYIIVEGKKQIFKKYDNENNENRIIIFIRYK